jgi:hypothetical protein
VLASSRARIKEDIVNLCPSKLVLGRNVYVYFTGENSCPSKLGLGRHVHVYFTGEHREIHDIT